MRTTLCFTPENPQLAGDPCENLCGDLEADPRRRSASLNVACGFTPSGWLAELLAAPEPKADRQYRVGAPGERLLPWTSDYKRVVLRDGGLNLNPNPSQDTGLVIA